MAGPPYYASSNDVDSFRLWMLDPLERGCSTTEVSAQPILRLCLLHKTTVWWRARRGLKLRLVTRSGLIGALRSLAWSELKQGRYWNQVLEIGCFVDIYYGMPKLVFITSWRVQDFSSLSPTSGFHIILELRLEIALMCLNLLRFPSCARTTHMSLCSYSFKMDTEIHSLDFLWTVYENCITYFWKTCKTHIHVDSLSFLAHAHLYYMFSDSLSQEIE